MAVLAHRTAATSCAALRQSRLAVPASLGRPSRRPMVSVRAEEGGDLPRPPTPDETIERGTGGRPRGFWDSMAFTGPAPEAINGRLAMLGFVAAMAAEFATGRGVLQQFFQAPGPILLAGATLVVASLIPILRGANLQESYGPWNPNAEILNGRVAMVGLAALFVTEYFKGAPLWGSGVSSVVNIVQ